MTKRGSFIPYMIIGGLLLFMTYIAQFVYRSMQSDNHLVSQDYYQKEINFQSHINKLERSFDMKKNTSININETAIIIEFPKEVTAAKGIISLYNPINPEFDKDIQFNLKSNTPIQVPSKGMKKGDWTIKIDFETNGSTYFIERPISI